MRFKIDENLPGDATGLLIQAGFDAVSVVDQQLGGGPDPTLAQVCRAEDRTLVTLDLDFADIRAYPPADYAGFIVLRPASQAKRHVLRLLDRILGSMPATGFAGQLWIVDEVGIRIRM